MGGFGWMDGKMDGGWVDLAGWIDGRSDGGWMDLAG